MTSWSDTQIVATVVSGSVSGVVRVQQNALWSNAKTFTVPGGGNTLAPNVVSMVVGDTRTLQVLGTNGQPATGLTWTSSGPSIVSLSAEDPPVLTALAPGHVTITAGAASADITVYLDALPPGTPIWSNPGDGSGVSKIVPAVPSATGVADVFAFSGNGTVQAITADGTTAWSANTSYVVENNGYILPDFQGGLVIHTWDDSLNAYAIKRFDGLTGQLAFQYVVNANDRSGSTAVHTDGTVFVVMDSGSGSNQATAVVGIDPATGTEKFRVTQTGSSGADMIIAGDGYAYLPYTTGATATSVQVKLLRVSSGGAYTDIDIATSNGGVSFPVSYRSYPALISNGDDGVLLSWASYPPGTVSTGIPHLTKVSSTGVSDAIGPDIPGRADYSVIPLIQRQDGTFVGTIFAGPHQSDLFDWVPHMVAFDANGTVLWDVPNEQPMIATADSGVIGWRGTIYDQNGIPTGVSALKDYMTFDIDGNLLAKEAVVQSWTLNAYVGGAAAQRLQFTPNIAAFTYAAFIQGGPSHSGAHTSSHSRPHDALYDLSIANLTAAPTCDALLGQFASMKSILKAALVAQIKAAAIGAKNYVYDGPSSSTPLDTIKFPDIASPGGTTVGHWFTYYSNSASYVDGLSQFNGYAVFFRFDDWKGRLSKFRTFFTAPPWREEINSYGMGTVMHEILHKQMVGGGFTHDQMDAATGNISSVRLTVTGWAASHSSTGC